MGINSSYDSIMVVSEASEAETKACEAEARAPTAEAEAANAQAKVSAAEAEIAFLKLAIEKLRREFFGSRSERKQRLLDQLELQLDEPEVSATEDELAAEKAAAETTQVKGFAEWVAYGFTTAMEEDLDRVAAGGTPWTDVLEAFWGPFEGAVEAARELRREDIRDALENALERYLFAAAGEPVDRACPDCDDGELMLKLGRFGPFVSCANFPDCRHSRPLSGDPAEREEARRPVVLGADAETGLPLTLRRGRYGRYIQLGEDEGKTRAPRRTVPASIEADEITPELARALLALPRIVGVHPQTGKTIRAGIGRYGAWLKHGATYVPLPDDEDVLAVGLNRPVRPRAPLQTPACMASAETAR